MRRQKYNTDWTGVPVICSTARVQQTAATVLARVVHLDKAFIRGSIVSGTFKVAPAAQIKTRANKRRIEVECLWFGRKPKTSWMHLTILSEPRFEECYSKEVAWNIER